jgi:hypothetical protein
LIFAQKEFLNIIEKEESLKENIEDLLTLLCFDDPMSSPYGDLLENKYREKIASNINSLILQSQNMNEKCELEVLISHLLLIQDSEHFQQENIKNFYLKDFI